MKAVIVDEGNPGRPYGEPRAQLEDGRVMPMGWNAGTTIPVGTTGEAQYVMRSSAGLWLFTPNNRKGEA